MLNMRPPTGFCCGCSLDVGVKVITLLHLAINVAVLSAIFNDIVHKSSTFAVVYDNDLTLAMLVSGWTLCGVLLCATGFQGTVLKSEPMVRVYWFYALACYIIMIGFVIRDLIMSGPCESLPQLLNGAATAATCGVFRTVNAFAVGGLVVVPLYFLVVVQAYRDNVAYGGGPGLGDLAGGSDRFYRPWLYSKRDQGEVLDRIVGGRVEFNAPGGYGSPSRGGGYGAVYHQAAAQGLGGSRPLFGNTFHDLSYPRATNTA
jgi:hypothetical protein